MPDTSHFAIPFLSPAWILGLGGSVLVMAITLAAGRRLDDAGKRTGTLLLGAVSITQWTLVHFYSLATGRWSLIESLPFHLCGISGMLALAFVVRPRQWSYETVYYWGIPGAAAALLTPELNLGDSLYLRADFYVGHGIIVLIGLWATLVLGMRPRPGSWWRAFLWIQLLLPVVGLINWLLGSNYMFLSAPPIVDNPLVMGEWPWHILGFEIIALTFFALMYLPIALSRRRGPRPDQSS